MLYAIVSLAGVEQLYAADDMADVVEQMPRGATAVVYDVDGHPVTLVSTFEYSVADVC